MNYDLNSIIRSFECSIKWLKDHQEDHGIKDKTIERHVATLHYLKELKELKEKIDNPTTQVIVADHYNNTYDVYRHYGESDLDRYLAPKPAYTNQYDCKSQDHKIKKEVFFNNNRFDVEIMHPFTLKPTNYKIKKVEFNGPATIIFWDDNTKTVVKNYDSSEYDREKGILYAVLKKLATKKEYNDILRTIDKGRTNYEWI